uniref:Uncharacterized protein n=1 Tax=Panagrolaimus superbus TaxID=310955 RepID=A0A914Y4S1_9BILA
MFDDTYFNKTLLAAANKVMQKQPETVQREEEETEPPSKRSTNCDPRPVDPAFVPPAAKTNSNKSLNNVNRNTLKSPPPPQELTSEEEDESEMHICPPRNLNYYTRFASKEKVVVSPDIVVQNADEHLLDSDNEGSSDVVIPESQDRLDNNTVLSQNDEEDSDDDVPQYPPRNLDIYKSSSSSNTTSTSIQPVIRRSVFDDVSDDEEIPSDRQKKIIFDEETAADNEHVPKKIDPYSGNSRGSALQPHETIDDEHKVRMEGPNPTILLTVFPNQIGPCYKPEYLVLEKWESLTRYDHDIKNAFLKFKNSEYVTNLIEKSPEHLFIFDSMMSGIPFEKTYKKVVCIDCGFPNNPL